mgnify:CR=1 FL=1
MKAETIEAVHTHTHTVYLVNNIIKEIKQRDINFVLF